MNEVWCPSCETLRGPKHDPERCLVDGPGLTNQRGLGITAEPKSPLTTSQRRKLAKR